MTVRLKNPDKLSRSNKANLMRRNGTHASQERLDKNNLFKSSKNSMKNSVIDIKEGKVKWITV